MIHDFKENGEFTLDMNFSQFLRKKRRLMGLNQTDFADFIGVNQGTISMWELGVTSPPIDYATEILDKIGGQILLVNLADDEGPWGYNPWQE